MAQASLGVTLDSSGIADHSTLRILPGLLDCGLHDRKIWQATADVVWCNRHVILNGRSRFQLSRACFIGSNFMTTGSPDNHDENRIQRLRHRRSAFPLPLQFIFRRRLAWHDVVISSRDRAASDPGSGKCALDVCQLGIQLHG